MNCGHSWSNMASSSMRSTWSSGLAGGTALPGSRPVRVWSRGFHPRLSSLFTFSERPSACQVWIATSDARSSSAERMDTNSRGCQPTGQRPKTRPTLKGSNKVPTTPGIASPFLSAQPPRRSLRPFQGRTPFARRSVGFTHGYSHSSPPVNRGMRTWRVADLPPGGSPCRPNRIPLRLRIFASSPHA